MKTIADVRKERDLPAVVADHTGCIVYVNDRFESVFGWKAQEISGKLLTTIIPRNLHDAHHLGFSRFLSTGTPTLLNQPLRLKAVTKDGKEFNAEHFIVAEKADGQWVFGATVKPLEKDG